MSETNVTMTKAQFANELEAAYLAGGLDRAMSIPPQKSAMFDVVANAVAEPTRYLTPKGQENFTKGDISVFELCHRHVSPAGAFAAMIAEES